MREKVQGLMISLSIKTCILLEFKTKFREKNFNEI